jgi:cytochrome c
MEFNKIFASILMAGIIAMLAGFVAKKVVHVEKPEKDAYVIEAAEVSDSGAPKKKAGPEPIFALLAAADIEKGKRLSKACAACHNFEKGAPHKLGPNMWDKINAQIAAKTDFAYSDALTAKKAEGLKWTYEEMNAFLWKPKKYAPGTKMSYIGMRKAQDRADIIAWMRTLSDSPAPLPTPDQIAPSEIDLPQVQE